MQKSEVRLNHLSDQWVIFAPARGKRPSDFAAGGPEREVAPVHDEDCPFCPGNEADLSEIVHETMDQRNETWQTRTILNKFPALTPDGTAERFHEGIYTGMPGVGRHEVIIETPLHNRSPALMEPREILAVVDAYHQRYVDIMSGPHVDMVVIFRNHGPRAGTSLVHPHSQIIGVSWAPRHLRLREERAQQYYDRLGRCIYCDILEQEMKDRRRSLFENSSFFVFVPYFAQVPFESWIVPKQHKADFCDITESEKTELAVALRNILGRLYVKLNDPDYNYVIHTAPRYKANEPHLHWYLRIRPRLTTQAGFEIGSGISINPSMPEDDAEFLRTGP